MEATHIATLNGHELVFAISEYDEKIQAFVDAHGPGVPCIRKIEVAPPAEIDQVGKSRAERDERIAANAGFAFEPPIYSIGTTATGMQAHREAFERLPNARKAAKKLQAHVQAEKRQDITIEKHTIRMTSDGRIAYRDNGQTERIQITREAIGPLSNSIGMSSAGNYLRNCPVELRALNINHWNRARAEREADAHARPLARGQDPYESPRTVLRTRIAATGAGDREIYGVVSEGFTTVDVDAVAGMIYESLPEDARAEVYYNGYRLRFDAVFFTDIPVGTEVAGEVFKVGSRVRTVDTGGGALIVEAFAYRNNCCNFMIIGKSVLPMARIRHFGDRGRMIAQFRAGFSKSLKASEGFRKVWGYAVQDDVIAQTSAVEVASSRDSLEPIPVSKVLPGLFSGMIERELVPLPKSNRQRTVESLVRMYEEDELHVPQRPTRAALANAVTRYASRVETDPFRGAELERAAGLLVYGNRSGLPAIPYSAI